MTDESPQAGPQHDFSAEKTVLRGMFGSFDLIADIVETVTPSDFYRPAHEHIYLAPRSHAGVMSQASGSCRTPELGKRHGN
ncbi:DnaB-like helicase N-terminal domain-containing protein [Streptomyces smyrnaeus]|uniref:DnaB-like helicase N-terminal domain-containing protein n=1 Tax=Streptomyces smyrnaeus TaxID=1387713 RepID=UPI000C192A15